MKNKIIALTASLAMLGGAFAALPAAAAEKTLLDETFESEQWEVGATGTAGNPLNNWEIYGGESKITVAGDETNKYLEVTRTDAWLGAGYTLTVETGKTYNVSLKIKSAADQTFKIGLDPIKNGETVIHPAVVLSETGNAVKAEDGWTTVTGTWVIP